MTIASIAHLMVIAILITAAASQTPTSYINHTVGGTAGWFFNSTTSTAATNYSSWASTQTFNLGDYLIFKTNSNLTVIETYNETTFRSCVTGDESDDDTFVYNGGTAAFGAALAIAVPLTLEGTTYYFSDADDGVQCQHGMAFQIHVNHGLGLPPSLSQPPPPPYMEPPGPNSSQSPPITIAGGSQVPENAGIGRGTNVRVVACAIVFAVAVVSVF